MKMKILFPLCTLALLLAGAGCNKAGKLSQATNSPLPTGPMELKLKWPPGERVVQDMDMKTTSETTIPGRPAPMQQNMTMGQKYGLTVLQAEPDHVGGSTLVGNGQAEVARGSLYATNDRGRAVHQGTVPVEHDQIKLFSCHISLFKQSKKMVRVADIRLPHRSCPNYRENADTPAAEPP